MKTACDVTPAVCVPPTKRAYDFVGVIKCQACHSAANIYRTSKQAGFINCPECGFSQPLTGYCFNCG